ncbi:AbrB family transcriptional regulator [Brucellaceae bacterium C25G]
MPALSLNGKPVILQWILMIGLSVIIIGILEYFDLPAGFLLGAMIAAIIVATHEGTPKVPQTPFYWAQGLIGCLIASSINEAFLNSILLNLPLFICSVLFVLIASTSIGYLLGKLQILNPTTAIWGTSPGAASALVALSSDYGADARIVALMQYMRVALVAGTASLVTHSFIDISTATVIHINWFPPIDWKNLTITLLFVLASVSIGKIIRTPSAPLMLPLFGGIALQELGWLTIVLPPWLLVIAYVLVGWRIGLSFTRAIIAYAIKVLPSILLAILCLITVCGIYGAFLSYMTGIDLLTAYLATSPGGADTIAIIAASSNVDIAFIIAMQTSRFFIVLLIGPWLAKAMSQLINKHA